MVSDVSACHYCGKPIIGHGTACNPDDVKGLFVENIRSATRLTEADIRRIVREELDRAKGKP